MNSSDEEGEPRYILIDDAYRAVTFKIWFACFMIGVVVGGIAHALALYWLMP